VRKQKFNIPVHVFKRSQFYKITCNDCDLVIAIRYINPSIYTHTPLRPLYNKNTCPFCQTNRLKEQEILAEEYQLIEKNWDLIVSGNLKANLAEVACDLDEGVGEIDISKL